MQVDPNLEQGCAGNCVSRKQSAGVNRTRTSQYVIWTSVKVQKKSVEDPTRAAARQFLDNEYDDILSVLDTPAKAHAPSRAIARTPTSGGMTVVTAEDLAEEPERPPITRDQLRSYRNARQFWMLLSFLDRLRAGLVLFRLC